MSATGPAERMRQAIEALARAREARAAAGVAHEQARAECGAQMLGRPADDPNPGYEAAHARRTEAEGVVWSTSKNRRDAQDALVDLVMLEGVVVAQLASERDAAVAELAALKERLDELSEDARYEDRS